ncbi:MAG: SGNH/GDSL hydrolase family protein [Oscillospiraceae bacterium]|jgi:lysophospholipase L1-like esterase|nr:SGNH/GDSL hydrolase family protein [Oscillospiraceae bacterium]
MLMKKSVLITLAAALFLTSGCKKGGAESESGNSVVSSLSIESSDFSDLAEPDSETESVRGQTESEPVATPSRNASSQAVSSKSASSIASTSIPQEGVENMDFVLNQAKELGLDEALLEKAVVNKGNQAAIANAMKKAQRGESVTVGVIGGSITQGSKATVASKSYASLLKAWWQDQFPGSTLKFINAGVGATDSLIGVHRMGTDLLRHNPDFIVVEFAVNDVSDSLHKETCESLVRRILKQGNKPGVLLLFLINQNGESAQTNQQAIGANYDLPMISYKTAIWPEIGKKFKWADIAADNVHPNNTGHAIIGVMLKYYLAKLKQGLASAPSAVNALANPITKSGYENAVLLTNANFSAQSLGGFTVTNGAYYQFPNGWTVKNNTAPIVFEVTDASNLYILYHATTSGNGGKVLVSLDGGTARTLNSDASDSFERAETYKVLSGSQTGTHRLEIKLQPAGTKDEFTILGILKS